MLRHLTLLSLLAFALSSRPVDGACPGWSTLVANTTYRLRAGKAVRSFDRAKFEATRDQYEALLAKRKWRQLEAPTTAEEKAAFLSALLKVGRSEGVDAFALNPTEIGFSRANHLAKALGKTDFSKKISPYQLKRLIELGRRDPKNFLTLLALGWEGRKREALRQFMEDLYVEKILGPKLKKWGYVKPNSSVEETKTFVATHLKKVAAVLNAAGLVLPIVGGNPPAVLPLLSSRLKAGEIPKSLWKKFVERGFDAVYPDLRELLGARSTFDFTYGNLSWSYSMAWFGYALVVWQNDERKRREAAANKAIHEQDQEINALTDPIPSIEEQSARMFHRWEERFTQEVGYPPDPNSDEYKRKKAFFLGEVESGKPLR